MTPACTAAERALADAVAALYGVFSDYGRPTMIQEAMGDIDENNDPYGLLSTPLRQLTAEQLGYYAGSALYTMGSVDDFKHYLPRLLELVPLGGPLIDATMVLRKLPYAEWETWSASERRALDAYFETLWDVSLSHLPGQGIDAGDCLDGLVAVVDDFVPYVRRWWVKCEQRTVAVHHLFEFIALLGEPANPGDYSLGEWFEEFPEKEQLVQAWLFNPGLRSLMLDLCSLSLDPPYESDVNWVRERYLIMYERYHNAD